MRALLFVILGLLVRSAHAQLEERYAIGFADTLLFNDSLHYTGFGYDGPAPLFVQAWFPVEDAPRTPLLTGHQLRDVHVSGSLERVHAELLLRMDSAFIEYDLRYAFNNDSLIDYAPFNVEQVKDTLMAMPTSARRARLRTDTARPVIVYHHGSGGFSDENRAMAETFASFGFIVLACNFHWPLENRPYGYPLTW